MLTQRRLKTVKIAARFVAVLFDPRFRVTIPDLPADAEFVSLDFDLRGGVFAMLFQHPDWPMLLEDQEPPVLIAKCETVPG